MAGYYNPLLAYGEDKAIQDASEAGANGFIIVDLPPEEAVNFREKCAKSKSGNRLFLSLCLLTSRRCRLSYVPLIAPSTTLNRIKFLASIADSFIYLISKVCPGQITPLAKNHSADHSEFLKMGTTGSSDKEALNSELPDIISRVRDFATVPIAVGFGVSNRGHFEAATNAGADGVVIGSRIIQVIQSAPAGKIPEALKAYCLEISRGGQPASFSSTSILRVTNPNSVSLTSSVTTESILPTRFGQFGGQYVPEALFEALAELEQAHDAAMNDPEFWKEFQSYYGYINRPSRLYFAENLTKDAGGSNIWLKREDL